MDFQSKARRARLRLIGIAVGAAAAVVAGGIGLATLTGGKTGTDARPAATGRQAQASGSGATPPTGTKEYTPASVPPVKPLKPTVHDKGIGRGYEHSGFGALSAGIGYWQDLAFIDDVQAEQQWKAITSKASPELIDRGVSEVRKIREAAGLPPSGAGPDGLTFTTTVTASLARSLDKSGDVVKIWLVYDRYAVNRNTGVDDDPLKDQFTSLVLKWEDGDWKVSDESKHPKINFVPNSYYPDSKYAFYDGWRRVSG
ncbi:hypothetical protein [Streptomyces sp. NPDC048603]|uniref:hypothetical protein n=1 Tax=Streptomyces sp. NPDC048603 TaxID=3365577 RepID=UPI003723C752